MSAPDYAGFTFGQFVWWIGVVEDRLHDPKKLGRVQVRIFGYHSQDKSQVPKDHLPWAHVLMPPHGASLGGVGISPTGILEGSHVVGFFLDGDNHQTPLVLGTLHGEPNNVPDTYELTRGENIQSTFMGDRAADLITSKVGGLGGLGGLGDAIGGITSQINNTLTDLRNFTQNFQLPIDNLNIESLLGKFGDAGILNEIPGLSGMVTGGLNGEIGIIAGGAGGGFDIQAVGSMLQSHLGSIGGQIESLTGELQNLSDPLQISAVQAQIQSLTSQFSSIVGIVNGSIPSGLPGAADVMGMLSGIPAVSNALSKISQVMGVVNQLSAAVSGIKALANAITGGGVMGLINGLKAGALSNTWQEPKSPAAPEYPYNNVVHTESGQVQEFDNTPGKERYQRYHPSGSFIEVHPDGTQHEKVVKDNYSIVMGDDFIHVDGNVKVNIVGNATIAVGGSCGLRVDGDMTHIVDGDYSLAVSGDYSVAIGGAHKQSAGSHFQAKAPRVDIN